MRARLVLLSSACAAAAFCVACPPTPALSVRAAAGLRPAIPRVWDEAALEEWATPLAGLNARPTHISSAEYYALPVENLRSYPVYAPGREPIGYWARLQTVGPQPIIEPEKLVTEADWMAAGRNVFEAGEHATQRSLDPRFVAMVRDPAAIAATGADVLPDGTLQDLRWVPTSAGVAISFASCATCHTAFQPDGTRVHGAPFLGMRRVRPTGLIADVLYANRVVHAVSPFTMGTDAIGPGLYQAWGVPWRQDAPNDRLKNMERAEYDALRAAYGRSGGLPRWNGSLFFPAKVPDLIGVADRKYLDATATHANRGLGDLMRYAATVLSAETAVFGSHQMLLPTTRRATSRWSDEALYALALYIRSLTPPPNPNRYDDRARAGEAIFEREDCGKCHTPPLYTNNKLTLAAGFRPPADLPASLDVVRKSVGTDTGLALQTRKGTGYYKVPSLRGVWYRGRYLHDGAAATLEEMFEPARLLDTHVRGGWGPPGEKTRAIKGHDFGLELTAEERGQLIAFLRTL